MSRPRLTRVRPVLVLVACAALGAGAMAQVALPTPGAQARPSGAPAAPAQPAALPGLPAPAGDGVLNVPAGAVPFISPLPTDCPLTFSTLLHDFGIISDTDPVSHAFKVKNNSDKAVRLLNVQASCGCTTAKYDDTIGPGREIDLVLTFSPKGRSGRQYKSLTITTDSPQCPQVVLQAASDVRPRVVIEPQSLWLGEIPVGQSARQGVSITGRAENFKILSFQSDNPSVVVEAVGPDQVTGDGQTRNRERFVIRLLEGAPIGSVSAGVNFKTSDPERPELRVPVLANVVGPLRLSSQRVQVRVGQQGEPFVSELTLSHRVAGGTFGLLSADLIDVPEQVQAALEILPLEGAQAAGYRLRVTGVTPAEAATIRGTLVIRTDVAEMAELTLPLAGFKVVSPNRVRPAPTSAPGQAPASAPR